VRRASSGPTHLKVQDTPSPATVIRGATPEDIAALSELASRTFLDAFAAQIDKEQLSTYVAAAFSRARLEGELNAPGSTIVVCDSAVGLLGYARTLSDPVPSRVPIRPALRLVRLYVDARAHRHWTGKAAAAGL